MNDTTPALEIENLIKTFFIGFFRKRVDAVKGVDFKVDRGEIFGLLGPNGAGKTTLIKVAMGLVHATDGKVRIFGEDSGLSHSRKDVGYLPENPYFHEYLTPRELISFHGRLAGLPASEIAAQRDELITKVGLEDAAKRRLRKFSKGMLQRVGLAVALLGKPRFLILDEPMSGLDPIGRRFVADLIGELNSAGTTIMFSSHILSDVERLCNRVVILNKGLKVAEGTLEELLTEDTEDETLEDLFVRKALELDTGETGAGA